MRARKTELPASLIEDAMTWESPSRVVELAVPVVKKKKKLPRGPPVVELVKPAAKKKKQAPLPVAEPAVPAVKKKKKRNPNRNKKNRKPLPVNTPAVMEDDGLTAANDEPTHVDKEVVFKKKSTKAKNKKKTKRTDIADLQQGMKQSVESKSRKRNAVETSSSELPSKKKQKTLDEKHIENATNGVPCDANAEHNVVKCKDRKKSVDRIKAFKKDKIKKKRLLTNKKLVPKEKEIDNEISKPVRGMEGWAGLNLPDSILRALSEKGFKEPTEIQVRRV